MIRLALLCLLLPLAASAQVEHLRTFANWEVSRLKESYEDNRAPFVKDNSMVAGGRLIYNALIGASWFENHRAAWVIDEAGTLQVFPNQGPLLRLEGDRLLSLSDNQIAALDPVAMERQPLFGDLVARVLGEPQNGRVLALVEHDAQRSSLWSIDGDINGSRLLLDSVSVVFDNYNQASVASLDGRWAFATADHRVIFSDGTVAGTHVLRQFGHQVEIIGLTPEHVILHSANMLASLSYPDGQALDVLRLFNQGDFAQSYSQVKASFNGRVVFAMRTSNNELGLWGTDGSKPGTQLLATVPQRALNNQGVGLQVLGDRAYYFNCNPFDTGGWETDGTAAGTRRFAAAQGGPVIVTNMHYWGDDRMFIAGYGPHHYAGLWMLHDGQLKDCTPWPGYGGGLSREGSPSPIYTGAQHAYFQAFMPGTGREMFRIDRTGKAELVADLSPGILWSEVLAIGQLGPWFYFLRNHPGGGASLYRVRDDQPLASAPAPAPAVYTWLQGLASLPGHLHLHPGLRPSELVKGDDDDLYVLGHYDSPYGLSSFMGRQLDVPVPADAEEMHSSGRRLNFLARFRGADGEPAWVTTLGYQRTDSPQPKIAAAPDGGLYLCGQNSSFAPLRIGGEALPPDLFGGGTVFARLDSAGQLLWHTSEQLPIPAQMCKAPEGSLILGIDLWREGLELAGRSFDNPQGLFSSSGHWGVAKMRPDGTLAWAKMVATKRSGLINWEFRHLETDAEGRIYLLLASAGGVAAELPCEQTASVSVRVLCLSPDGGLLWDRAFQPGSGVEVTGMAVNRQGWTYICGNSIGAVQFGGLSRQNDCEQWRAFVLTLGREGIPSSFHFIDEEQVFVHGIALDAQGRYALSGFAGAPLGQIPYAGLAGNAPYETGNFRRFFVRYYSEGHQVLDEKSWYQHRVAPSRTSPREDLRLAHHSGTDFICLNTYGGTLDTFSHAPTLSRVALMLMRVPLAVRPLPPVIEDRALSAEAIQAFPNPAAGILTLQSAHPGFEAATLHLFNSQGQLLPLPAVSAAGAYRYLDVSQLPVGVYFLAFSQGGTWATKRIVVQR
jgi:hypothetical protein